LRAVLQKVTKAEVLVEGKTVGKIDKGLAILFGVTHTDTEKDAEWIAKKIEGLRIFEDENDKLNLSVRDIEGEILLVSQFTLFADARKGRRPSFSSAASPEKANELYKACGKILENMGLKVAYGQFRAHMELSLTNDGPVTILLDSEKLF
jgi:D-tyrosyl-tRNA(Tyr) deacylase